MPDKDLPSFDSLDDDDGPPKFLREANVATETIDLNSLFTRDVTTSGSFDISQVQLTSLGKLLQAVPVATVLIDPAGAIVFSNQAFRDIAGDKEEFQGKPFENFVPDPASCRRIKILVERVFATRKPHVTEAVIQTEKRKMWGRMNFRSLRIGRSRLLLVLIEDLTVEKKKEILTRRYQDELENRVRERTAELQRLNEHLQKEIVKRREVEKSLQEANLELERRVEERTGALKESEERSRSMIENATEGFYRAGWEGGFIEANPALAMILGYDSVEDLRTNLVDFGKQLYVDPRRNIALLDLMEKNGQVSNFEFLCYRKDRSRIWASLNARAVRDAEGRLLYFEGIFQDVTARKRAELAMLQAKEDWERTFDAVPDLIAILDDQHRIVRCNKAMADRLGVRPDEAVGLHCYEAVHGTEAPHEHCPHTRLLASGMASCIEIEEKRLGGVFEVRVAPIRDSKGTLAGSVHVAHDITERRKADIEIRRSEERFRQVVENANDVIYETGPTGNFTAVNPVAGRITGYSPQEIVGMHFLTMVHPDYRNKADEFYRDQARTRTRDTYYELPILTRDGQTVWIGQNCQLIEDGGKIVGFRSIARDITDRIVAEEKLRRANEFQKQVLATAATGIFVVNEDRVVTDVNEEFCSITGYDREEVVGRPCTFFAEEPCHTGCGIFEKGAGESLFRRQCKITARDGRTLTVLKNATLVTDEGGQTVSAVESFVDVTELNQARIAAETASLAKTDFLAKMSHEIRTPMNAIIGMTELALNTEINDEQREYLDAVKISAESLLGIINDVLDFSRIEAGKLELTPVDFSLRDLLTGTMATFAGVAQAKGLELIQHVSPSVPDALTGDSGRLRQILVNLVANAIKFTEHGEVMVRVGLDSRTDHDVLLRCSVSDTGIGIPDGRRNLIFEAFEQADNSTSRRYGGTGLGLAIASQLVQMMDGHIWVESNMGSGSTFHFTVRLGLQAAETLPDSDKTPPHNLVLEMQSRRPLSILLAEDNPINQKLAVRLLEKMGHSVSVAANGKEVLSALDTEKFDLVLMDVQMPEMDGLAATKAIRDREKDRGEHVPVVAMTAYALKDDIERCLKAGMDGHLSKPVDKRELFETIETIGARKWDAGSERSHATRK